MEPTITTRPFMPGYGIKPADEGTGLLPWSWAEQRLTESRDYWAVTVWPDGQPHAMPVWGVWTGRSLWFSSAIGSRKARNIAGNPQCVLTTQDTANPVVVSGLGRITNTHDEIRAYLEAMNAKYATDFGIDFLDPANNATIEVRAQTVIGLTADDFTGSPTRWRLGTPTAAPRMPPVDQ